MEKVKRHRRTKAEMEKVRAEKAAHKAEREKVKEEKAKRKRKYNNTVEPAQDRIDVIFTNEKREDLPGNKLREYLRDKYNQHQGLRIADRILQLVDEHEKMELQLKKLGGVKI
jgi:hypothetical protein